jgi:pheromone a factor receptor
MYGAAWNVGTCLYMIWTGLGCLLQSINSMVWNKNMIDRAPIYCDICKSLDVFSLERSLTLRHLTATRIQVALNVAIPACSLCINRRLYKIATVNVVMTTHADKRRAIIQDLLIGVGLPILQIIAREYAWPFAINLFLRGRKFRLRCFGESLQHI